MMFHTFKKLNEYKKEVLIAVSILHCIKTVNTALEFHPWYIDPLPLVYQIHCLLYFDPDTWYIEPATHGILSTIYGMSNPSYCMVNPIPMVYRTPYPLYIAPLSMVY